MLNTSLSYIAIENYRDNFDPLREYTVINIYQYEDFYLSKNLSLNEEVYNGAVTYRDYYSSTYDSSGKLLREVVGHDRSLFNDYSTDATFYYSYDLYGNNTDVLAYHFDFSTGQLAHVDSVYYQYDEQGGQIYALYHHDLGGDGIIDYSSAAYIDYIYDEASRLSEVITRYDDHADGIIDFLSVSYYFYDAEGNLIGFNSVQDLGADGTIDSSIHETYVYDDFSRVVQTNHWADYNVDNLWDYISQADYFYDEFGRVTSTVTRIDNSADSPGWDTVNVASIWYDAQGNLDRTVVDLNNDGTSDYVYQRYPYDQAFVDSLALPHDFLV